MFDLESLSDEDKIKILDQYGNAKLSYSIDYNPQKIRMFDSKILYIENSSIIVFDLNERKEVYKFNNFENCDESIVAYFR